MAQPLLLQGAPYEAGLAHGETLRGQIHEVVSRWKGDLVHTHQMDADEAIARFIGGTDFAPAIRRWTPDLLEEIRGIAAGADMAWETILANSWTRCGATRTSSLLSTAAAWGSPLAVPSQPMWPKEILTSKDSTEHPICGSKGEDEFYSRLGMFPFASTIMVLGDEPAFHVSFGPPDSAPYRRFVFGKPAVP